MKEDTVHLVSIEALLTTGSMVVLDHQESKLPITKLIRIHNLHVSTHQQTQPELYQGLYTW